MGIPTVMLKGKVSPNAIGIKSPGSALGAAKRMAAGTAMYEALAARIAKMNLLPTLISNKNHSQMLSIHPLMAGIIMANTDKKSPYFLNAENLFAVTIPISNRNRAKNPLKISVVKGLIPSACLVSAMKPIIRLPKINKYTSVGE